MFDEYRVLCNPKNEKKLRDEFINCRKRLLVPTITHLVLLEAENGGVTLDQTFTPPKCMGLSIFTSDAQQECEMLMKSPISKSTGDLKRTNPMLREMITGNRPERNSSNRKQEDRLAELLDDALHKEVLLTEPLLELPGERI